jgi:hypothetical protein
MLENVDAHISEVRERESLVNIVVKSFKMKLLLKSTDVAHLQRCEQCDEEYYSEDSLQAHMFDIHELE